eukprot:scaffold436_cov267-Pinguiococcus_pyrenoidosus.AAC.9
MLWRRANEVVEVAARGIEAGRHQNDLGNAWRSGRSIRGLHRDEDAAGTAPQSTFLFRMTP